MSQFRTYLLRRTYSITRFDAACNPRPGIHANESDINRDFIISLIAQRKSVGMTQRELAKKLGASHCYVARIETRERRIDLTESIAMMRALNMSDEQIIDEIKKLL